jgi:hypothetical protein
VSTRAQRPIGHAGQGGRHRALQPVEETTFLYTGFSVSTGDLQDRISESQVLQAGNAHGLVMALT